eukprot:3826482-Prymnesium_polylepis.1
MPCVSVCVRGGAARGAQGTSASGELGRTRLWLSNGARARGARISDSSLVIASKHTRAHRFE